MKKRMIAILILLAAVGGFAYWFRQREERADTGEMKLFGNVEIREVMLSFRIGGRLETLRFEEGARVSSGDLLACLDKTPYAIRVHEANAALLAAQANVEKMRHGYQDDDIRAARAQRDQVAVGLRNAEANYQRFKELYDQNIVARKEFDDAVSARDSIRAELSAAESNLHRLRGGFRSEDITAAEAQAEAAQAQLDEARTSMDDADIYAPDDGTIATRVEEPGSVVAAGQPVYSMMLARPIQVRAYVAEPRLGRVRLGMKGRVYTDSHPNEPIEGTVSFIAQSAEFTPKQVQTEDTRTDLVYRIRLLIQDNPQDRLKNGMPVTVVLDEEGE